MAAPKQVTGNGMVVTMDAIGVGGAKCAVGIRTMLNQTPWSEPA
jgi:hypothetical protein